MVTRGGRSKGCSNCRRRRIKCDETRPVCNRCKKRGVECDGPREMTFINESLGASTRETAVLPFVPQELGLTAFKDDIFLSFTRRTLLRGGPVEHACDVIFLKPEKNPGLDLLRDAIRSLAVTFYGSQHHQTMIMNKGYMQYGAVLRQLNVHLTQPPLRTTNDTITTALTCMLLEIFLPTGPNNFLKHMWGIESMLEMRGPPVAPCSHETLILLHGLRILSIVGGLATARPSLFSRSEWKSLPQLHLNLAGRLRNRIFDVLADCTRLNSEKEIAIASGHAGSCRPVMGEAKILLAKLESILPDWFDYNEEEFQRATSKTAKQTHIANHHSATVYMLYNTTYVSLLNIMNSMEPSPHYAPLRNAAALKIMKSLEVRIDSQREGAPETNTICFVAVKTAWQALGGIDSPEGRKLARTVKKAMNGVFAVGAWQNPSPGFNKQPEVFDQNLWSSWADRSSITAYGGIGGDARLRTFLPAEMLHAPGQMQFGI